MGWIENRPTSGWRAVDLAELWRHRELIGAFARRDVTVRYRQAALGVAWAILQPLSGALVFTVVFSRLAHVGTGPLPYLLFAYLGWVGWSYFAAALASSSGALLRNADLVTRVYFPRVAAPVAAVLPGLLDLAVGLVFAVPLLVWFHRGPSLGLLLAPAAIAILATTALGVGLALGALNVRYRDVGHLTALLVQLWLFASPVAYPSSLATGRWGDLYALNPVVGALDLLRWGVAGGAAPGPRAVISAAAALVVLLVGVVVFQRSERGFADVI